MGYLLNPVIWIFEVAQVLISSMYGLACAAIVIIYLNWQFKGQRKLHWMTRDEWANLKYVEWYSNLARVKLKQHLLGWN